MKTFFKNHIVAFCGVLSLIAAFLPFCSVDFLNGYKESITIIEIFKTYQNFSPVVMFIAPIALIVIEFVLKDKAKKIACIALSAASLIAVIVSFALVNSLFTELWFDCSPAIGIFIAIACDIALIILSIFFAGKNFESVSKTGKKVKEISNKVSEKAVSTGSEAVSFAKEQAELTGLKSEVNVIDKEIEASYLLTGKKFVDYVIKTGEMPGIDVSDVLKLMDPKMERKEELKEKVIKLEKRIMDEKVIREKQAAEKEFEEEKSKLEKALKMEVIDQADYDARVAVLQKKLDNFEVIRKLEQQVDLGLITNEEKDQKLYEILN